MKHIIFIIIFFISCNHGQKKKFEVTTSSKEEQEAIIMEHLGNASQLNLYSQERQEELDRGLAKDSTIAYLWQQKAMPLFKQGKYELGVEYIDKAVKYNRAEYQEYRAFIKCIFAKTYKDAIADFEDCRRRYGNKYVMDHTYNFYIALCKLQLNQFEEAEHLFKSDIEALMQEKGEDWVHHLDLFYYGISKYEQKKYEEANEIFDWALKKYPTFADVQYYKSSSLSRLGRYEEAKVLRELAITNGVNKNTINEDNVIYERYPYQVRWEMYE